MPRHSALGRRLRTFLPAVALAVLGSTGAAAAGPSGVQDAPTIDTYKGWDGSSYGCLNRLYTTCGQVITIPADKHRLRAFNFYLHLEGGGATIRAEAYTWDGTKAGREIWESNRRTLTADPAFEYPKLHFSPRVAVRPGQQYVLFLTFSKDYGQLDPDTSGYFAATRKDLLLDGYPGALDDSGDESQWTERQWSIDNPDPWELAMKIWLR